MKHAAFLVGAILLFLTTSFAQDNSVTWISFAPSDSDQAFPRFTSAAVEPLALASVTPFRMQLLAVPSLSSDLSSDSEPAAQRPNVYSVFETYKWQLYGGYAFYRFYAFPHQTETMNGVNVALSFYPTANWFGAEADIFGELGSFQHRSSKFASYLGGARARRRVGPRNV